MRNNSVDGGDDAAPQQSLAKSGNAKSGNAASTDSVQDDQVIAEIDYMPLYGLLHRLQTTSSKSLPSELLPDIVEGLSVDSLAYPAAVAAATKACRQIVSKEASPPIAEVIDAGLVPVLLDVLRLQGRDHSNCDQNQMGWEKFQILNQDGSLAQTHTTAIHCPCTAAWVDINFNIDELMTDAAWALTNVASGSSSCTQAVIDAGAIPVFINLLASKHAPLAEQAAWALGNIAGDGPQARDATLQAGALPALLHLLDTNPKPVSAVRNVVWTISNLCRGKTPRPQFTDVAAAVPRMADLLDHADPEVVTDAAWALSYLTDGSNDQIQRVLEGTFHLTSEPILVQKPGTALVKRLVGILDVAATTTLTPVLRTVGNILTGNDVQTQLVLEAGVLPVLEAMLTFDGTRTKKTNVVLKEVCWALSNITAGNTLQIQAVLDRPALMEGLTTALAWDQGNFDPKVQKEAVWTLSNLCTGASTDQLQNEAAQRVIGPLCTLLDANAGHGDTSSVVNMVRCAFFDRNLHSRMPLDPTHVRLFA
jgi:hypothetical protein